MYIIVQKDTLVILLLFCKYNTVQTCGQNCVLDTMLVSKPTLLCEWRTKQLVKIPSKKNFDSTKSDAKQALKQSQRCTWSKHTQM